MSGPLTRHPYLKSYDELQRTAKRMRIHRDTNLDLLSKEERHRLDQMIEHTELAIRQIPVSYKITKHYQHKED